MAKRIMSAQSPYGAFELKRYYQKNMFLGTVISGSIPLSIFFTVVFVGFLMNMGILSNGETVPLAEDTVEFVDVPEPGKFNPPVGTDKDKLKELIANQGIPQPFEGTTDIPIKVPLSNFEKEQLAYAGSNIDLDALFNNPYAILNPGVGANDSREVFVTYDQEPVLLNNPVPEYPEIAQRAGMECTIIMAVVIDEDGNIVDVEIARCSNPGRGFEEAAIRAAYLRKYSPALQNGNPVKVRLGYKIKFVLN